MLTFTIIFIVVIGLVILYKYFENGSYDVIFVKSKVNGKNYLVRNLPDKQRAADLLAFMNNNFDKLIAIIKREDVFKLFAKFVKKDDTLDEAKLDAGARQEFKEFEAGIARLIKNYDTDSLSENTPNSAYTSYSENKGQKIVFCLRSKPGDVLVDRNTMMFVGIHELSHLMSKSIGHNQEFWDNFRILLRIAIHHQIYACQNFDVENKDYCGTTITDTPLKCKDI